MAMSFLLQHGAKTHATNDSECGRPSTHGLDLLTGSVLQTAIATSLASPALGQAQATRRYATASSSLFILLRPSTDPGRVRRSSTPLWVMNLPASGVLEDNLRARAFHKRDGFVSDGAHQATGIDAGGDKVRMIR
ncbi:MAG: hypothetical protein DI613_07175 [Kocuria rhizophila]|nr:MAG: hypothetical protein DI613_07175 [Kocuria rhizophila]